MDYLKFHTIIIGAGAAGLNCALWLVKYGIPSEKIAVLTENLTHGTSFDAGSDKQTYYKLSQVGDIPDAPVKMAHALFDGGAMHGDIALIEATMSTQTFMHLVSIGVPFPQDETGAFVGYKTDNDPLQRGTSAGPLTSHIMGTQLLKEVQRYGIPIFDKHFVIQILTNEEGIAFGALAINTARLENTNKNHPNQISQSITSFQAENIVLATGGPAGCYQYSVYPTTQWGSTSLAIQAGCSLQNLTESQFGLASLKFRWNVSGTYQQVIPRYFSIPATCDPNYSDSEQKEFLKEYFPSITELTRAIFLKGYQWPFNSQRIQNYGSSLVDLAIHHEIHNRKRRVFMDFRKNPLEFDLNKLDNESKDYLLKSGAVQNTPIERLKQMNNPAIELYQSHGINLWKEPLEIGICAQHCNGGVTGDIWWQTSKKHLFAIGELNGSHGVHRPGGAALNSGQVGAIRAAMKIAYGESPIPTTSEEFHQIIERIQPKFQKFLDKIHIKSQTEAETNFQQRLSRIYDRMNKWGMYIRTSEKITEAIKDVENDIIYFQENMYISSGTDFIHLFRIWDALLCQHAILISIQKYLFMNGGSRGSSMVIDSPQNTNNISNLHPELRLYQSRPENPDHRNEIIELQYHPFMIGTETLPKYQITIVSTHDIPQTSNWFEKIYNDFRNNFIFKIENIR